MIIIGKPYITECDGRVRMVSHIINEGECREIDAYFSVEPQYQNYLCSDTADAFLLSIMLRAVVTAQDIEVEALLSEKLLHNLRYGVLYALKKAYENTPNNYGNKSRYKREVQVTCKGTTNCNYGGTAVGTGCSLGVDSFSVIKKYFLDNNDDLPNYKITHFACFNVGAFGSFNTDATRESFNNEVAKLKQFSSKLCLPVVSVDTNLHEFYPERDFNWSHSFLNMSCVLSMQKFWGKYLYAAGYSLENFKWDIRDSARYEPYLIPNLSTESTELVSADMNMSRADKVHYIMDDPIVKDNISVCLKEQSINDGVMQKLSEDTHRNCGHCEKCMRTMLQLDIYGRLNDYGKVFDLSDWPKMKDNYMAKILSRKYNNLMYNNIASTMAANGYIIPNRVKVRSFLMKSKMFVKSIIKR